MIRKFTVLAAALALAACGDRAGVVSGGTTSPPIAPVTAANLTTADEQARLRAEQAYKLSRTLGELAIDTGLAKGENLIRLRRLDDQLWSALQTVRAAYRAANSSSLQSAAANVSRLADQVEALVKGSRQ